MILALDGLEYIFTNMSIHKSLVTHGTRPSQNTFRLEKKKKKTEHENQSPVAGVKGG
jgi:hypothetical protein